MRAVCALVFAGVCIAGCAYNPPITEQAREELAKPIDCTTAATDIRVLETEKASCDEQVKSGVKMIVPASAARSILHRDYLNREEVATGEYNRDIDAKIKEIKEVCGLQ